MANYNDLLPPVVSVDITRGQTYLESWLFAVDGVPFDFTGATITAKVTPNIDGSGTPLVTFTQSATLDDAGLIELTLTAAQTAAIAVPASPTSQVRFLGHLIVECVYADTTADQLLRGTANLCVSDLV